MSGKKDLIGVQFDSNNCGAFVIKACEGRYVDVEFLETGFKSRATKQNALNGRVKDRTAATVCGVGRFGVGVERAKIDGVSTPVYECWSKMIKRCYCEKYQKLRPTYIGCKVCDEWLDFQVFAKWYNKNYPSDGKKYQLDKDLLAGGRGKLYSPSTCSFITLQDNVEASQAKRFKFKSPAGEVFDVFNISKFCRDNGLNRGNMTSISLGVRKSHKGWTAA